jgi:hypothetical protein
MKMLIRNLLVLALVLSTGFAFAQTVTPAGSKPVTKTEKKAAKAKKQSKKAATSNAGSSAPIALPATFPVAADGAIGITSDAPIKADSLPVTTMAFEHDSYDFGKIKQGDVVKHSFKFTNTGKNPLVLENVKPSCGCTAIDWPKGAIAPGQSSKIDAQFNSAGKSGAQLKYITVVFNGDPKITRITFSGEVILPEGSAPAPGH